jgi:hypothetical protein
VWGWEWQGRDPRSMTECYVSDIVVSACKSCRGVPVSLGRACACVSANVRVVQLPGCLHTA